MKGDELRFVNLPKKFVEFNSLLGLLMVGFGMGITPLEENVVKGCWANVSRGSRNFFICLKREI